MPEFTVPAADTNLHAIDAPGSEPPLLFVNGGFATLHTWKNVKRLLDGKYRAVTFDARARGKSGKSSDYSAAGAVDDIGRIIRAARLERPVLVGWSHGATTALRYATTHPEDVRGLVLLDGAYPITSFPDAESQQRVRTQFRRMAWMMKIGALAGLSAKMPAAQAAEVLLDMDAMNGSLIADYARLPCPADFVFGTGGHSGTSDQEMDDLRDRTRDALKDISELKIFATAPFNHVQLPTKGAQTVVDAIEDVITRANLAQAQPTA